MQCRSQLNHRLHLLWLLVLLVVVAVAAAGITLAVRQLTEREI